MKITRCDQRSPEWFTARLGKLTGSRASDMLATVKTKGAEAASRRNLRVQLVLERLTGQSQDSGYLNGAMQWGIDHEADACRAYEAETGILVTPVGFVDHDTLLAGCSPDGLTEDGLIEIKCPESATHLDYLKGGIPEKYLRQMTHNLWITGRAWADFVSFDPRFPEPLRLKITRVLAKDLDLKAYELMARLFLDEVEKEYAAIAALAEATA